MWFFHKVLPVLLPCLTMLVNRALVEGMPLVYRHALVSPRLKKKGSDRESMSNYRPVSQLHFLSKLIERVVARRLTEYLTVNELFDSNQAAYRSNHLCETVVTHLCDAALRGMDTGRVTALLLLDLSSAFDTVDHSILLECLSSIGVQGEALRWFSNYLTSRSQSVCIEGSVSALLHVPSGVPQGSVLGPLLFVIYLLRIGDVIRRFGLEY